MSSELAQATLDLLPAGMSPSGSTKEIAMKITRKNWRARMSEDLLLADYTDATRESYLLSTRQLFDWLKGEPEQWDEDDVRRYFVSA